MRICAEEFESADRICQLHMRMCGFSVWREGHALDMQKLRRRRRAKLDLKRAHWYLQYTLANTPPAGIG